MNNIKEQIDRRLQALELSETQKKAMRENIIQQARKPAPHQKRLRPFMILLTCCLCIAVSVSAFALQTTRESQFYLRYFNPADMAVSDAAAAQYGPDIYFKSLKSGDIYNQYFAIHKLITYYNDAETKQKAIGVIRPFLDSEEENLRQAASFALSILEDRFDDPHLVKMADGSILFSLFPDYSDYGGYHEIYQIKDGVFSSYTAFSAPSMYITQMLPSPDGKLLAVATCSNKSNYIIILDKMNDRISPELVDSARIQLGQAQGFPLWQRIDHENYCGISDLAWLNDTTLTFSASLSYQNTEIIQQAAVTYQYEQENLQYRLLE